MQLPTTWGLFSLPSPAATGSLGFIWQERWQNLVPIGSSKLNGAFHPSRQGCHYPSSRSFYQEKQWPVDFNPFCCSIRAEEHKRLRSRAALFSEGQENRKISHLQESLGNLSFLADQSKQFYLVFAKHYGSGSLRVVVVAKSLPRNELQNNTNIAESVRCGVTVDLLD